MTPFHTQYVVRERIREQLEAAEVRRLVRTVAPMRSPRPSWRSRLATMRGRAGAWRAEAEAG